jgi:hypothetical protein
VSQSRKITIFSHTRRARLFRLLAVGLPLWLAYLLFVSSPVLAQGGDSCPINPFLDGRQLYTEGQPGDRVYIVCVDLTNPYLRFQTVMANDVLNVNPQSAQRETVASMVNRSPYNIHNPIIAFNADYFGNVHGAEGLSVVKGYRIDGPGPPSYDNDNNEVRRISLAISRLNVIEISHKEADEVTDEIVHLTRFYNASGGGPRLMRDGQVIPNPCLVPGENVGSGPCRKTAHTAVGMSQDGRRLIIVVAESRTGEEMGQILQRYGAHSAMKLDGSNSSQLWFEGDLVLYRERSVANAILIFHEGIPRHDAFVLAQSEFPIAGPGEEISLSFTTRNVGFLPWDDRLPYALQHVGGERFGLASWQPVPATIEPNSDVQWHLTFTAPQEPGAYITRWQMAYRDNQGNVEPIGPRISYIITVLPEGSSFDLAEAIRQIITQAQQELGDRINEYLEDIQRQIEAIIERELNNFLENLLQDLVNCLNSLALMGIALVGLLFISARRRSGY